MTDERMVGGFCLSLEAVGAGEGPAPDVYVEVVAGERRRLDLLPEV